MEIEKLTERAVKIRDLYTELEKREGFRVWTARETYNGLVSDVGDLGRLVLAKEGYRNIMVGEK